MTENNKGNKINAGYFGPGVIGKELAAQEQAVVERQADIFGPGVLGLPADPVNVAGPGVQAPAPAEPPAPPAPPMLSVKALREALDASPLLVDTFLPVEQNRPEGPRKGAVEALFEAEEKRPGGAREDVLSQIVAMMDDQSPADPAPDAPNEPAADPAAPEGDEPAPGEGG